MFLGQASCSSSACHGGAGEIHNQFTRWSKLDYHTRAYATLTLNRSARIADVLKIKDPTQSARCTVCHAPFQTLADHAKNPALDPTVGVSCETCHGPAEHWLLSHTRTDFSHADRVKDGMRDLADLYVRANTCIACHQNVDADIIAAGHPELIFELDGQSVTEPRHWREKSGWSGPQTWLVGQAAALRELSAANHRGESNPEKNIDRELALEWLVMRSVTIFPQGDVALPAYLSLSQWADKIGKYLSRGPWPADATRQCLDRLAATSEDFRASDISSAKQSRRAERLVLALDRLVEGLNDDALAKRLNPPLNQLFKDAQSLPDFNPEAFADQLDVFQKALHTEP